MSEERETYTAAAPALDLDAIEARVDAATPGPWEGSTQTGVAGHGFLAQVFEGYGMTLAIATMERPNGTANAAFIAAARTDVPALVAEVRRLRADNERIGRERDDMTRANAELQARLSAQGDDGK